MIIVYKKLNLKFKLDNARLNSIVVENNHLFEDIIIDFYNQVNGSDEVFSLFDCDENLNFARMVELIASPFDIQYDKRSFQKKLFANLSNEMHISGIFDEIAEIYSSIITMLQKLNVQTDYSISFSDLISVHDVLKNFDVHLDEPKGNFAEKVIEYFSNVKKFLNKSVLVIANCDAYLEEKDYVALEKWAAYYETYVLFIRNKQHESQIKYNEVVIDNSLCII